MTRLVYMLAVCVFALPVRAMTVAQGNEVISIITDIENDTDSIVGYVGSIYTWVSGSLYLAVDEIRDDTSFIRDNTAFMVSDVDNIRINVAGLAAYVDQIEGYVDTLEAGMSAVGSDTSDMLGELGLIKDDAESIRAELIRLGGGVGSVYDIGDVVTAIESMGTNVANIAAETDALANISSKANSIDTRLGTIDTRLGTLNTNVATISGTATTIAGRVSTTNSELAIIKTTLTSMSTTLSLFKEGFDTLASAIVAFHTSQLTKMDSVIAKLTESNGYLETLASEGIVVEHLDELPIIRGLVGQIQVMLSDYLFHLQNLPTLVSIAGAIEVGIALLNDQIFLNVVPALASIEADAALLVDDVETIKQVSTDILEFLQDTFGPEDPPDQDVFDGPDLTHLENQFELYNDEGTIATGMAAAVAAAPKLGFNFPDFIPMSSAPVWTFTVAMPDFSPMDDQLISIDWSFWTPFRLLAHAILTLGVGLKCVAMVWEELRKYG